MLGYLALGRGEFATATELLSAALSRGEAMTELHRLSLPLGGAAEPATPRGRVGLAAAAVGLVAAGGLGGFVLGQATSSSADETGVVQPGQVGTEGGTGQFPGGGRPDGDHGFPPGRDGTVPDDDTARDDTAPGDTPPDDTPPDGGTT